MTQYIIQSPDGSERQCVEDASIYEGWTTLAQSDTPVPEYYSIAGGQIVPDLDRYKLLKRAEVDAYLAAQFDLGFAPTAGPLVGHTLQARDVTDRTNWLTSQAAYSAEVAGGAGAVLGADFRDAANVTVTCSYADGLNTLLAMAAWGKTLMGKSWTVKDQIQALTSLADIQNYDVAAQWGALP